MNNMDKTIKLKILNDVGNTEHYLENGDIIHYNLNGDMIYSFDDKYKTIETVVYADIGVPMRYKIEIYGQTFVYSFNEVPYITKLDELFDMLKHKYIRQAYAPVVKYHYPGYAGQTNQPIVADWDVSNIDCYGTQTHMIDISVTGWDFSNVPTMRSMLDVGDDCYGLDYGIGSMTLGEYIEHECQ